MAARSRFEGGMTPNPQGQPRIRFKGQGTATAEGLRNGDLGLVSRLVEQASGSAAYTAELGFRAGVPELSVRSNLQGMASSLPAPLAKAAADSLRPALRQPRAHRGHRRQRRSRPHRPLLPAAG